MERKKEEKVAAKAAAKAVKKIEKQQPQKPPRKTTVLKTNAGLELGMTMEKESADRRKLARLERQIKAMKKSEDGPKVQSVMTTTLTLGSLLGTSLDELTRQMRIWLNPCQLKPADSEETATPLSIRGSQYDLWKPLSVFLTFQPLVGPSVITGSICFADLDQDGSAAKPENIDSVKARPHCELSIGQRRTWKLPPRLLKGPRAGWWYVDTNESPLQSLGPAINMWTYMKTRNVMGIAQAASGVSTQPTTAEYDGPLFLAEMRITYAFANYNPKPALAQLAMKTEENKVQHDQAKFANDEDGNVVMEITTNAELALFMDRYERAVATTKEEKSSVAWSVAGEAVGAISSALGPWGWLVRGGWWVIRRIFGAKAQMYQEQAGVTRYMVYPSVEDAMRDNPIKQVVNSSDSKHQIPVGIYRVRQLNNPNVNTPVSNQQLQVTSSAGTEPGEKIVPSEHILPTERPTGESKIIPPIYNWTPVGGYDQPGLYENPDKGGKNTWTNIITFFSLSKVLRLEIEESGSGARAQQFKYRIRPRSETGDTPLYGNQGMQFCMPYKDWLENSGSTTFYWLELTYATSFFPSVKTQETGIIYNKQGQIHTKTTLCESFREQVGLDSPFNLKLMPFHNADQITKWGETGWGFETIMDHCRVDLTSDRMVAWPVFLWGSTRNMGIMFIMPQTYRIGVFCCPTTTGAELIGKELPVWGSFCWPSELSLQWGQAVDNQSTWEREFVVNKVTIPKSPLGNQADSDEEFVKLPDRSEMNEKQNYKKRFF